MITLHSNERMLIELNTFIHKNNPLFEYHMKHINLVKDYALILNKRLNLHLDNRKLRFVCLAHDILKERSLHPGKHITWRGHEIPQDLNWYVRTNLDILEQFKLDDYFNSSCQYHALAAGIFLYKELKISDPEIIYPIMFHSCQIISVYETLSKRIRDMVDVVMISDKLSSNWLRINFRNSNVRVDLDQVVFGNNGMELNYSLGLYIARLISQGKDDSAESLKATEFYYKRLSEINPFVFENYSIKKLGGVKNWPLRNSQVWKMQ